MGKIHSYFKNQKEPPENSESKFFISCQGCVHEGDIWSPCPLRATHHFVNKTRETWYCTDHAWEFGVSWFETESEE